MPFLKDMVMTCKTNKAEAYTGNRLLYNSLFVNTGSSANWLCVQIVFEVIPRNGSS